MIVSFLIIFFLFGIFPDCPLIINSENEHDVKGDKDEKNEENFEHQLTIA